MHSCTHMSMSICPSCVCMLVLCMYSYVHAHKFAMIWHHAPPPPTHAMLPPWLRACHSHVPPPFHIHLSTFHLHFSSFIDTFTSRMKHTHTHNRFFKIERDGSKFLVGSRKFQFLCGGYPFLYDLGEPTHTLVPCWMPKPLPPRNRCTGWFAPTFSVSTPPEKLVGGGLTSSIRNHIKLELLMWLLDPCGLFAFLGHSGR